ncbi:Integrase, catalytic core [Gossypium australe]|uniref:Integrase, catalytic core n=1 Tax=Gossypium australe TaxID=47621 RepID=A0A5B6UTS1_9ROSI|nr:Integrase, catalytic core [Gossypium australe]
MKRERLNLDADEKNDEVECYKKYHKPVVREYKPPISYPEKVKKDRIDEQYGKFLKLLKILRTNLSFVEVLSQMPKYTKFLKELLTNKRKLDEFSTVPIEAKMCTYFVRDLNEDIRMLVVALELKKFVVLSERAQKMDDM